jgi:hypothetical protein
MLCIGRRHLSTIQERCSLCTGASDVDPDVPTKSGGPIRDRVAESRRQSVSASFSADENDIRRRGRTDADASRRVVYLSIDRL